MTAHPDRRKRDTPALDPDVIAFRDYLAHEKRRSPRTVVEYARDVELFGAFLEQRPSLSPDGIPYRGPFADHLRAATISHLRRFMLHLGKSGLSPSAMRRKGAVLRRFYWFLRRQGVREDNPALELDIPSLPKRLPKAISASDVEHLLSMKQPGRKRKREGFLPRRNGAIMELLYGSALRRAELASLDVGDVDLDRLTLRVIGKGNKQRMVFINEATAAAIRRYLEVRPATKDDALFVSQQKRRLSHQQVGLLFKMFVRLSGLKGKITPHTLRHSFATHMIENGADIMTVKEFLGHENVSTTQIYAQVTMEHMRRTYQEAHPRDGQLAQPKPRALRE